MWREGNCVYPQPAHLQDSFRVPCVFRSTVWGIRKLTVKELVSTIDPPQGNAPEELALASAADGELMSSFLALPPVKSLQFELAVTLRIGSSNTTKLKAEDNFGSLPPLE